MKKIFIALLPLLLIACAEEVPEKATINYKLTVKPSQRFDYAKFTFEYTRAHRNINGQGEIRSVYLDPKEIETNLSKVKSFPLGSSEIEPAPIDGYDFGFSSSFAVVQNQDTLLLQQPSNTI